MIRNVLFGFYIEAMLLRFDNGTNNRGTFLIAEGATVEHEIIVMAVSPFFICECIVMTAAGFVRFLDLLYGGFGSHIILRNTALNPSFCICIYENFKKIKIMLKNGISTSTDNYAAALFCTFCNDLLLCNIYLFG